MIIIIEFFFFESYKSDPNLYSKYDSQIMHQSSGFKKTSVIINKNDSVGINCHDEKKSHCEIKREKYASILEYLEAKYSRGVMISDFHEKLQHKKKITKKGYKQRHQNSSNLCHLSNQTGGNKKIVNNSDDMNFLYESEEGSCYTDISGNLIDDSELRSEVAHQIFACSTFITTKYELENYKKIGCIKKNSRREISGTNKNDSNNGLDYPPTHNFHEEYGSFFVNVGELEVHGDWLDIDKESIH